MTPTLWLFISLILFLSVTTLLIRLSQWAYPNQVILNKLWRQTKTWWVILIVVGSAFLIGHLGLLILFFCISFYAFREFISLIPTRPSDYYILVVSYYVALPIQYLSIALNWTELFSIFIPVYVFMLLPALALLGDQKTFFLERFSKIQWGLMLTVYGASMLPAILTLNIPDSLGNPLLLLAWFILVVQLSDIIQYLIDEFIGSHPFMPTRLHNKTWEGLCVGIPLATLIGMGISWLTPFSFWEAGLIAIALCTVGTIGRLIMSVIKQSHGVNTWGYMLSSHGGMLDRVDSICFAAPLFYHIARLYWSSPIPV